MLMSDIPMFSLWRNLSGSSNEYSKSPSMLKFCWARADLPLTSRRCTPLNLSSPPSAFRASASSCAPLTVSLAGVPFTVPGALAGGAAGGAPCAAAAGAAGAARRCRRRGLSKNERAGHSENAGYEDTAGAFQSTHRLIIQDPEGGRR